MRRFLLWRRVDDTGISGTGVVAEGVIFGDGGVAMRWRKVPSTTIFPDIATVEQIHGHGGKTRFLWVDDRHQAPHPVTRYDADGARERIAPPHCRLLDGWGGDENGLVDREGTPLFVGQQARLRTMHGEVGTLGEIISFHVYQSGEIMVGMFGTDCGPASYPLDEIVALETPGECVKRNGGRQPRYGWAPAVTIGAAPDAEAQT